MSNSVQVHNISSQTSEKEVRDFFSFCGKISSLSLDSSEGSQAATVSFEKETAAKTALLLDNTQLGPNQVHVSSATSGGSSEKSASGADESHDEISQEDKPRSRIVAEYLAHGYVISDKAIERAIALDQQHGVSNRFVAALQQFDAKTGASATAQKVDAKYGVSDRAAQGWHGLSSYFEQAISTPTGQRVRQFYESGNKQVLDVHEEARRLADLKSGKTESGVTAESAEMEKVPGTEKTKCNCAGTTGKCPCAPGKCACAGCGK